MKPKAFPESNVVYGENQEEYFPLPAHRTKEGIVISCWELSDEEIEMIKETRCVFLSQMTFNQPLQPVFLAVDKGEIFEPRKEVEQ